jgi:phosphoserine phosphatase
VIHSIADPTTVFLIRHGATEWNESRRAQGHADVPLNERGRRQTEETVRHLAGESFDAVYSSDLMRALDTARPLAAMRGLKVEVDPGFREIDQGEWEGLTVDEIKVGWPELWGPARHTAGRPGGELPGQVRDRAVEALRRVAEAHPGGRVAVVSHGGTIRWLVAEALGYGVEDSARLRGLGNGSIVVLEAARLDGGRFALGGVRRWDGRSPDSEDPNQ